jgi:hypothetical protein
MQKPLIILVLFFVQAQVIAADNYPVGARATALSNAFVSLSDTWSIFHNPATLTDINGISAGVFYESRFMLEEFALSGGTVVMPTNSGTFALGIYQMGKVSYKQNRIGLAYAKQLSEKVSAALQLIYFNSRYPENEKSFGFATFDFGLRYKVSQTLTVGTHIFNPVHNGYTFYSGKEKMPISFRLGGHYQFSEFVLLSFEGQKLSNIPLVLKSGIEFSPLRNLIFRAGVSGKPVKLSAGIGYRFGSITTDIAFSYHGNLGFSPSVSIQFKRQ